MDFGDILDNALVFVKRRKCLADFIEDKDTDLVNKYAKPQEKVSPPNKVEPFTYPALAQDLTSPSQFYTLQGTVQDIPAVRIHTSQTIGKVKAAEVRSGANDCKLISDPAKYFYEDLGTLFTDLKPRDEEVAQLHVGSVTIVEPFDDTYHHGLEKYAHTPDNSSKRTPLKFLNLFDAGIGARKKAGTILGGPAGFDGIVIGQGVIKNEDHG